MNRGKIIAILLLFTVLLAGCSVRTAEDMYAPPKRSEDYNNLQSAIDKAMEGMDYCAPLAGDHQQTVQMADLNGDGDHEFLLFAKGSEDRPLRILIFHNMNGNYILADTIESNGTAFEQVEYVQMDGKGGVEIVVGCQINDLVLRAVNVYTFSDGQAEQLLSSSYTRFLTVDMDNNGRSELFILRPGLTDADNGVAEFFGITKGVVERSNEVSMSRPSDKLKRVISGKLYGGQPAVYAASAVGESEIVTDVYAVNDGRLTNVTFSNESGTSMQTVRNYYVYANDIDNDGVVELPDLISMAQIDELGHMEKQELIRWYAMKASGEEVEKVYTYHNFISGWYLQLESRWAPILSVQYSGNSYEFSLWDEAQNSTEKIFTVFLLTGQNREEQSIKDGRFVLYKTDAVIYAAALESSAAALGITPEDLIERFHLIRQEWKTGET